VRRILNSDDLGSLLAAMFWILVVFLVMTFLRALIRCGWLCLD
jgi:hypothetical protein